MDDHYPPTFADATPADVLAIIRDQHRQQCTHDPEADPDVVLGPGSTVADWRRACDLVAWEPLAQALNAGWEIDVPLDQWRSALEPPAARTLGGVCDLIARHAKLPRVRPARLLGRDCLPAGVFLTVRSYLASAGADVRDVAPSTPLADYTRRYASVFLGPVSQLAPGALPVVKIRTPVYHGCVLAFAASWLGMVVGLCSGLYTVSAWSAVAAAVAYGGIWVAARNVLPASVEFEGLRTFRDLSTAIAAGARA